MKTVFARLTAIAVAIAVIGNTGLATADLPRLIHYQGKLRDAGGVPINATVSLRFRLYDDATAGSTLFDETHPSVSVSNGLLSVLIGSQTGDGERTRVCSGDERG